MVSVFEVEHSKVLIPRYLLEKKQKEVFEEGKDGF